MRQLIGFILLTLTGCSGSGSGVARAADEPAARAEFPRRYDFLTEFLADDQQIERLWASLPYDSISLERTSCFGRCPQYTVVFGRGERAEYRGRAYVPREGTWHGYIGIQEFGRISHLAEIGQIERLPSRYEAGWTDDATAILRIWRKGEPTPVVVSDYGNQGPTELWAVREAIDGLTARMRWHPGRWRPYSHAGEPVVDGLLPREQGK